jgi:hypothetical protein
MNQYRPFTPSLFCDDQIRGQCGHTIRRVQPGVSILTITMTMTVTIGMPLDRAAAMHWIAVRVGVRLGMRSGEEQPHASGKRWRAVLAMVRIPK